MGGEYRERPDKCPLCEKEKSGLDFHHWDYDDDSGCYVCEPCHIAIHGGTEWWNAHDRPARSKTWKVAAIENLVRQHIEYHSEPGTADEIVKRYNIPDDKARGWGAEVEYQLDALVDGRVVNYGSYHDPNR